jgi:RNA polymerase sigma-70 factor (ECF subfamily)
LGPKKNISKESSLDDHQKFKKLFELHYRPLTVFALEFVGDLEVARDIVQGVFVKLWEIRETLNIKKSEKAYLYQCVKNACINYSKSKSRTTNLTPELSLQMLQDDVLKRIIDLESLEIIYKAIENLPIKCREIFKLSRFKQLKHSEIALKLNISEKTIENQISIALKKLSKLKHISWIAITWFILLSFLISN